MIRRGPSDWCRVGRWDVDAGTYEPGPWLHGTIYPQRCDLSPDGRYLAYFAYHGSARWELGATYVAISLLPQLTALAAWRTDGTWTRGTHFVDDVAVVQVDHPHHGALPADLRAGVAITRPASYAVERRRGWTEAPGSPPRADGDVWDERRAHELGMEKRELAVRGGYAAFRTPIISREIAYRVGGVELPDLQWADWASDGRLLVATRSGRLETREGDDWTRAATVVADLSLEAP